MRISRNNYEINGLIDTNNSVLDNMNNIATAAGCWITFDSIAGKWSVIINKAGPSVKSFDDSNIIGSISLSGKGITELYNSVSVAYPHKDIRDQTDYIEYSIDPADRFPNEQDNTLHISMTCINNPIQAQFIGMTELRQSRMDKIIQFTTDYTSMGIKGGDIIDVTATMYGFDQKLFRVTKVVENDADDGTLQLEITALEYSDNIYDDAGLIRKDRSKNTGIIPKAANSVLLSNDNNIIATSMETVLGENVTSGLLNYQTTTDPVTGIVSATLSTSSAISEDALLNTGKPKVTISGPSNVREGKPIVLNLSITTTGTGTITLPYTITGVTADDIGVSLTGNIAFVGGIATFTIPTVYDLNPESETLVFSIYESSKSIILTDGIPETFELTANKTTVAENSTITYTLKVTKRSASSYPYTISGISADDLTSGSLSGTIALGTENNLAESTGTLTLSFTTGSVEGSENIILNVNNGSATLTIPLTDAGAYSMSATPSTIIKGQSTTITCNFSNSIPDGTIVPYVISGAGTGSVSTALTGTVTISGSSASLIINTISDSYSNSSISVKFGPTTDYGTSFGTVAVTINAIATNTLATVTVPISWACYYDAFTGQPLSIYSRESATFYVDNGGTTVPTSLTIDGSGVITIASTAKIYTGSDRGGKYTNILTSFNTVGYSSPITGTTITAYSL
jgi:hypothetical protein